MPINILDPNETAKRAKCYQAADMVEIGFVGSESLSSTNVFTEATYTADQNYFLVAVSMSMVVQTLVSGAVSGIAVLLGWFKSAYTTSGNTGINPGNSSPLSTLPGALAMVTSYWTRSAAGTSLPGASPSNLFMNFHPYGVYLPKGNQLFLLASAAASGAFISYSTILYLMPTFQ